MKVKDKVIVVTGGGNGMGREMVLNLLAKGAMVAAVDINEEALNETARLAGKLGSNLTLCVVDITKKEQVEALPAQVIARFGAVDGIINNAGVIQPFLKLQDLPYDKIDFVMNVNLYGPLYMVKAFLPELLKRPVAHIANVSSMGGFLPVPGQTIYGATKAAVKLMTEGLYAELLDTNVKVTVIYPGAIGTNISVNSGIITQAAADEQAKHSTFKMLDPVVAAEIMIDAIEQDKYSVHVGSDSKMMDIMYRLNPKRATGMIYNQMKALLAN
jgi:short-subunit dehydrogenase